MGEETNNGLLGKTLQYRSKFCELLIGLTANQAMVYAFDYALYPFVVYRIGILWGGVVMMFLSFFICLLTIWFYDWSKRDWLGIEAIKELKEYDGERALGRITAWVLKRSDPVAMLFFSIKFDPFITMVYLRRGAYTGMNRRDWRIFMGSLVFSNVYWTLACYMGISLVEWGWKYLKATA